MDKIKGKVLINSYKEHMKKTQFFNCFKASVLISLMFLPGILSAQEENLNVFQRWVEWSDGKNMLNHHLNDVAFSLLDKRDKEIAGLSTEQDWIARQKKVRETLMKISGPFPEKTPLNPKITGIVKKDGFKVEKIIFESMPGFYVTGCLFIPDGKGKKPAVLNVIGHTGIAFRAEGYQKMILHLVQKGFIVFAIDPVGQGERSQYWNFDTKQPDIALSATQHSYFGSQCLISGVSSGKYFIWDGIRAIDYLVTRKEVDPERIGVTGISGGGTQTAYISALDERVKASAPTCYITGFRRLLESIGAQDAEQNMYHMIKEGLTHADYIVARAPKPTVMVTTTRDFFSIQGARETFREVSGVFKAMGNEADMSMVEDDDDHALTLKNNTATVAFFQKYFNVPGDPEPGELKLLTQEELTVTPQGQMIPYLGGETVFSLNKTETQKLMDKLAESRKNPDAHLVKVLKDARELSGYVDPPAENNSVFRGRYRRGGYSVEMYSLKGNGNYVVPLLLFVPATGSKFSTIIYLHPQGKIADAAPGGKIEQLVKAGYMVAAPDVLGTGEVSPERPLYGEAGISQLFFQTVLTGTSIAGIQATDIGIVINFLKTRKDADMNNIAGMAFGEMGPSLLHAAAMNKSIKAIVLTGSPVSYRSIVMNQFYNRSFVNSSVAGALTAYDLPDLIAGMAPGRVMLSDPKDHMNETIGKKYSDKADPNAPGNQVQGAGNIDDLDYPVSVYEKKGAGKNLVIVTGYNDLVKSAGWCFGK